MITNLHDFVTDYNEFRNDFRDDLAEQFEYDFYIKSFSKEVKFNDRGSLQNRITSWRTIVNRGIPIPNNVYDFNFEEFLDLSLTALLPERQEFAKILKRLHINS